MADRKRTKEETKPRTKLGTKKRKKQRTKKITKPRLRAAQLEAMTSRKAARNLKRTERQRIMMSAMTKNKVTPKADLLKATSSRAKRIVRLKSHKPIQRIMTMKPAMTPL